jgi:hypothetical protein
LARRKIFGDGQARTRQSRKDRTAQGGTTDTFRICGHGPASARRRLVDAQNNDLDPDSQFDLAYGAAHRLALAALRREGYRSADRITVFQTLVHTLGLDRAHIQTFLKAHNERNLAEYQGRMDIDAKFLADLLRSTKALEMEVAKLPPPAED